MFRAKVLVVFGLCLSIHSRIEDYIDNGPLGEPLILTKYIKNGKIVEGQAAATVVPFVGETSSYSGFFTVNEKYDSNLFFWYFESLDLDDPVVIWLQGGPGSTSLSGALYEVGPIMLDENGDLKSRRYSWSNLSNLVFIDNPVGTGFSFTNSTKGYAKNQLQIGNELYSTVIQFLQLFPHLQKNDLYIAGESYAGKYIPALAHAIHRKNPSAKLKVNLKGVSIGNGFIDPINMLDYSSFLYQLGLIDDNSKDTMMEIENEIRKSISSKKFKKATNLMQFLLIYVVKISNITYLYNYISNVDYFNYSLDRILHDYLDQGWIKARLHVGRISRYPYSEYRVKESLRNDIMKSVSDLFEVVVNNYRVVLHSGQLDLMVPYVSTVNFLRNFNWCGHQEYMAGKRKLWYVGSDLAGYSKTVKPNGCNGSLVEVLVRNSGHSVPKDKPEIAYDIIRKLVRNEDF